MSFDDYANHIYQKHRLAAALGILKSKPANLNTEKYLKELKSNIEHNMDDDDITVCSDDFLMDNDDDMNDSVNILKDFNPEFLDNDENLMAGHATTEKQYVIPENLQVTYYNSLQTKPPENIPEPLTPLILLFQDEHNLNQKNIETVPKNTVSEEFKDRARNDDQNIVFAKISSNPKVVNDKETEDLSNKPVHNESMDATYYDSQKTINYTVPGFTQNCTHYSPSQNDIVIPNKFIYGVIKNKNLSTDQNIDSKGKNATVAADMNGTEYKTQFDNTPSSKTIEKLTTREEFKCIPTINMILQRNDDNFDEIYNANDHFNDKIKRTFNDEDIIVNRDTETNNIRNSNRYSQNIDEYFNEIQMIDSNVTRNSIFDESNMNPKNPVETVQITDQPFTYNQNFAYDSQNIDICNSENEKAIDKSKANDKNHLAHAENSQNDRQLTTEAFANVVSYQNKDRREEHIITEEEYNTEEIISYKVLEEFNKVKSFLNRQRRMSCDGYSTDSGYRSDSQIRSSNKSALQLSGNWLNQSGCCLFNYIMQCTLVAGTRDITNEIAQVLGQLIDKLHEEEKYPSFLEDLLEVVNILLRQLFDGESSEDGEFLKKDENIHRILLLNKSIHIQKHSIEKITNILEIFHSKITEIDSTYELSNIDQIENVTYIFHILEILLKQYLKNREELSQTITQHSQDDEKVLKKSTISDIWRKKWNPSQKIFEGSSEKKCVLKICSEILNKIVVDCVSSYSLVAYSALKCFNSMQS